MQTLRIFISSPGDVARERHATDEVIRRLQGEFAGHVILESYFWEWEPVDLGKDYQANIPSTSEYDIVICLLWSRLGSRLGEQHKLPPDYTRAASSGTEYELMQALHGKQQHPEGLPDLLLWVNQAAPPPVTAPPLTRDEEDERIRQRRALQDFLDGLTRDAATGTFVAAVNNYQVADDDIGGYQYLDQFEELMEQKLRRLIQKRVGQRKTSPAPQWKGSPFRNLDVFEFEHAPIFFGRSRAVGEVTRLLQGTLATPSPCHFAIILGASGSGKSSLARAGVMPMLTRPGVIEGVGLWRCVIMRPSDDRADLFEALASALLRAGAAPADVASPCPPALPELADPEAANPQQSLARELRANPESVAVRVKDKLAEAARAGQATQRRAWEEQIAAFKKEGRGEDAARKQRALDHQALPVARLALLLDQMEELFTLNYAPEQLQDFLRAIDVLARCGRVFVVGTLRSDFYPRFQEQETLVKLTTDGARFDLLPPNADEISQIIRRPATLAGLTFEEDEATRHSLADTLRDEATADAEALPLLEHVLSRLYQAQSERGDSRLTFADHETLGGVGGALARHAEETFRKMSATDAAFDAVFRCVVTFGKGEQEVPNRQAFAYDELVQVDAGAAPLVDAFIRERLFIADQDARGRAVVRLSHEALLKSWPRLSQWLQTAHVRDFMSRRRRLIESERQWREGKQNPDFLLPSGLRLEEGKELLEKHGPSLSAGERAFVETSQKQHLDRERGAARRRNRIAAGFAGLALASLVLAWLSFISRKEAVKQGRVAETQRDAAARSSLLAVEKSEEAEGMSKLANARSAELAETLAASYFREGSERLLDSRTSREGLAYLARSVREHGHAASAGRLLTFFQQRAVWIAEEAGAVPPAGTPDAAEPRIPEDPEPPVFPDQPGRMGLAVAGPHGETAVSWCEDTESEEGFQHRGSGIHHFRVWDPAGKPVTPWIHADHEADSWVGDISSMTFSGDGAFLAVTVERWRQPEYLQIWDLRKGKQVGETLIASGGHPNTQGAVFTLVSFTPPASNGERTTCELVAGSSRGDAIWIQLARDTPEDEADATLNAVVPHRTPVRVACFIPGEEGTVLVTGSDDGEVIFSNSLGSAGTTIQNLTFSGPVTGLSADHGSVLADVDSKRYRLTAVSPVKFDLPGKPVRPRWISQQEATTVTVRENSERGAVVLQASVPESAASVRLHQAPSGFTLSGEDGSLRAYTVQGGKGVLLATAEGRNVVPEPADAGKPRAFHAAVAGLSAAPAGEHGGRLVTGTADYIYQVMDLPAVTPLSRPMDEKRTFTSDGSPSAVDELFLSPSGGTLLSRSEHWEPPNSMLTWVMLWDCASGEPLSDRVLLIDSGLSEEPEDPSLFLDDEMATVNKMILYRASPAMLPVLADLAEALAGLKLDATGELLPVPQSPGAIAALQAKLVALQGK